MAELQLCCRSGGSNLNSGSRTGNSTVPGTSADLTYTGGSWNDGTGVFTVASGNPSSDGVAVDDIAAVYTSGDTETPFIGRVTARNTTTITVSLTEFCGIPPATGTRDLKIGGAWSGPTGSTIFPFSIVAKTLNPTPADGVRVNLKADLSPITPGATGIILNNPYMDASGVSVEGFTVSYGDAGRVVFDDASRGNVVIDLYSADDRQVDLRSIELENGARGLTLHTKNIRISNFAIRDMSGAGLASAMYLLSGGFVVKASIESGEIDNCVGIHYAVLGYPSYGQVDLTVSDVTITNSSTAIACAGGQSSLTVRGCVIDTINGVGILGGGACITNVFSTRVSNCSGTGISCGDRLTVVDTAVSGCYAGIGQGGLTGDSCTIERCSVVGNTTWGVSSGGPGVTVVRDCIITENGTYAIYTDTIPLISINNAFWSNTSGTYYASVLDEYDNIDLTGDPFVDWATGNFALNATIGAGADCTETGDGEILGVRVSYMSRGCVQAQGGGSAHKFWGKLG